MRITQGCFSFLPDLTDQQTSAQVEFCLNNGWSIGVEYTDDPHPRNMYWQLFGHHNIFSSGCVFDSLASSLLFAILVSFF